jgi:hypothetical protein
MARPVDLVCKVFFLSHYSPVKGTKHLDDDVLDCL